MQANSTPLPLSLSEASPQKNKSAPALVNPFTPADVERILRKHGWLRGETSVEIAEWVKHACEMLGPQAAARSVGFAAAEEFLESLLLLICVYDAPALLKNPETHVVLAREGSREVIRELAIRILICQELDSGRFREVIDEMKSKLGFHGRKLFHPIRLALAGRAGEGELDRVILLLDGASKLNFSIPVKGARQRMIEFCAAIE